MKENRHLHARHDKHLACFDFAFVYICRNKTYAWKPFTENESNFKNKVNLQGATVDHMGFLENTCCWDLMVPFGGSGAAVPPCGVHLLQRQSPALVFVLQKTKSHDQTLSAFALVSVSVIMGWGLNAMPYSEDAMSPPGGPDGDQGFTLPIFCFVLFNTYFFASAQTTEFT